MKIGWVSYAFLKDRAGAFTSGKCLPGKGNREGATGKSESALGEGRSERENSRREREVKGGKSGGGLQRGAVTPRSKGADAGEECLLIKDLN